MEQKGLDIVRRDWSPLAKAQGNLALNLILSGRAAEDVEDIHESLRKCREDLVAGAVTMDQFVIPSSSRSAWRITRTPRTRRTSRWRSASRPRASTRGRSRARLCRTSSR